MSFLNEFRRYAAFTLAEVLIVMGIIGIIAEMVMPDLSKSVQENVIRSQVKEIYSSLSQATLKLGSEDSIDTTSPTTIRASYANALAYDNSSYTSETQLFTSTYKYYKSSLTDNLSSWTNMPARLRNGMFIDFNRESTSCTASPNGGGSLSGYICSQINVDVNGNKGPNMWGKDFVTFWLVNKDGVYKIYPEGAEGGRTCTNPSTGSVTDTGQACTVYYIQDKTLP